MIQIKEINNQLWEIRIYDYHVLVAHKLDDCPYKALTWATGVYLRAWSQLI